MTEEHHPISEELIAPCGMNCAICSKYLAYKNQLKKSQCMGCRPRNQACTYLFARCDGLNHAAKSDACFCFECEQYPCQQIKRMDKRYKKNYQMSVIENLEAIQRNGIHTFIEQQYELYQCESCRAVISIHNRKCFQCDTITKLVEKHPNRDGR